MSAFVVDNRTINRVVTFLRDHPRLLPTPVREGAETLPLIGKAKKEDRATLCVALGQAMFDLNVAAVEAYYGPGKAAIFRGLAYAYREEEATTVQVLKSLSCWLYQCSEGSVPKQLLYRVMDEDVTREVALEIVGALPAYEQAHWG